MSGFSVQESVIRPYSVAQNNSTEHARVANRPEGNPQHVSGNPSVNPLESKVYEPRHIEIENKAPGFEFEIVATVTLSGDITIEIEKALVEYFIDVILLEMGITREEAEKNPLLMVKIRHEAVKRAALFRAILREEMIREGIKVIDDFEQAKQIVERAMAREASKVSTKVSDKAIEKAYLDVYGEEKSAEEIKQIEGGAVFNSLKALIISNRRAAKLYNKYLKGADLTCNDPLLIKDMLFTFEIGSVKLTEKNLAGLEASIRSLPDSHPDKAFFLARYAFLLSRTGMITDVDRAREIFKEAGKLNKEDARVLLLQARFHLLWGEYEKALNIYEKAKDLAEKKEDLEMLCVITNDLVAMDLLIAAELSGSDIIPVLFEVASFIGNPLGRTLSGFYDVMFLEDRKKYKEEDLQNLSARTHRLAVKSVKALEKICEEKGDSRLLIHLSRSVLYGYNRGKLVLLEKYDQGKITKGEHQKTRAVYDRLFVYFYPEIARKAIEVAEKAGDLEGLLFIANDLFGISQSVSDMSSYDMALRGMFADLSAKALKAAALLTEDEEILANIGRQLFVMDRYKDAIKVFEKLAEKNPEYQVLLDYAYLALGRSKEAHRTFTSSQGEFGNIQIIGAEAIDEKELEAALLLLGLDQEILAKVYERKKILLKAYNERKISKAEFYYELSKLLDPINIAIKTIYRNKGYRAEVVDIKFFDGKYTLIVKEVEISGIHVATGEENESQVDCEELADWISYFNKGGSKKFNLSEIEASIRKTENRVETFTPRGWRIERRRDGSAELVIDVNPRGASYIDAGYQGSTVNDDWRANGGFGYTTIHGNRISVSGFGGEENGETLAGGALSYYDPDVEFLRIDDRRIFSNIEIYRQSYTDYFEGTVDTKLGGSLRLGTDIGRNTTAWIQPWGYGLEESGEGVGGIYAGITYDTRKTDRGNYFSVYAGPGYGSEGAFFKTRIEGRKYIPLKKGFYLAVRGYGGLGASLPSSETFNLGSVQSQGLWRGRLDDVLLGNNLLGASVELRTGRLNTLIPDVSVEPYLFLDGGTVFNFDSGSFNFLPVGGAGIRIYHPAIGCINLYYGWPLGSVGEPHFGFLMGEDAVY